MPPCSELSRCSGSAWGGPQCGLGGVIQKTAMEVLASVGPESIRFGR